MPESDYIVVGAGASGCVVAARLAERGHEVLLLEAGGLDANPMFRIPGLGFMVSLDPKYNWMFKTEPVADMNGRELTLLQGRVVGGSSSINGMMYNRGNPAEYDVWRQLGCEGWTYPDLLPCFARAEARLSGGLEPVGEATSLRKNDGTLPVYEAFLDAAREVGYPIYDDLTAGAPEGFGLYHTNVVGGRRISSALAYLPAALRTGRLTLRTGAQVGRVLVENGEAVGVEMSVAGRTERARARREVILCGGGIKSPHILLLSGIGPADQLREFGIEVVADAPKVGENLQNHPCYRMQFSCRAPVTAYGYTKPVPALLEGLRYVFGRRGVLAQTIFGAGGYMRSDPRVEIPDIQVVLAGALNPSATGRKPSFFKMLPRRHGFTAVVYQGTPFSVGRVALRSADPSAAPKIDTRYFSDHRDIETLINGMRRVRDIVEAGPLARLGVEEISPGPAAVSDEALETAIRAEAGTAFHQSGTCAMGGRADSVVDPQLRVRGVKRLRVADASVIPRVLNAGLHGPSLMIGEKAADLIDHVAP